MPKYDDVSSILARTSGKDVPADLLQVAQRLRDVRLVRRIGIAEGDGPHLFGLIEGVAVSADGSILILDSRFNEVRLFDSAGRFRTKVGGPGRGPNEFLAPEALGIDGRGRVVVADRGNQLKLFVMAGDRLTYESRVAAEFVPEDMCVVGDFAYVQGFRRSDKTTIHRYGLRDKTTFSFGPVYESANWLVQSQLSDGSIGCTRDVLVYAFRLLPIVRGYTRDGTPLWIARIRDFGIMNLVESIEPDGRPSLTQGGKEFSSVDGLVAGPAGTLVLQVRQHDLQSLRERREFASIDTYVLSPQTGVGAFVGSALPRIGAVVGSRVYAIRNDPFPELLIFEMSIRQNGAGR
jgi:hypothetical protein